MTLLYPSAEEIAAAHKRILPLINQTPVLTSSAIDSIAGASLFFKCENFQRVGAFKARGACNAVLQLSDLEAEKGVVTHSSGNHAAALSYAAHQRGIDAYIVMPENAPKVKKRAVEGYGGKITFCKPTLQAREDNANAIIAKTGATLIHPYDNHNIVAGQATAALELIREHGDLDCILTPVGGGGLASGSSLSAHYANTGIKVFAGEPENVDDAFRSMREGRVMPLEKTETIADGLKTTLSERTFNIISNFLEEVLLVSEEEIVDAMRLIWERMKIIIEPSSAVPFAAALRYRDYFENKKVGIILSGGNVDLNAIPF